MFDIGFWELTMIAVIALLVIGPDKLPGVARTAGKWVGRARRFVGDVKTDIDRELKQEEIRKALAEDAGLDPTGMTIKSSRKTWESGLYRYIPSKNKLIIGRFKASQ